jgi:hypothetical protein
MHQVTSRLVGRLQVTCNEEELFLRLDGPDLVARLLAGELRLSLLVGQPDHRRVPLGDQTAGPRFRADTVVTIAVPFTALEAAPGAWLGLALLVTDAADHIVEQHPTARLFEIQVPEEGRVDWLV